MAYIASYSEVTELNVPREMWIDAWFALMGLKGYVQSTPSFVQLHISIRPLPGGDIRLLTRTVWKHLEVLQDWLESEYTVAKVLGGLDKPAYDVSVTTYEDLC